MKFILASQSPQRKTLLEGLGVEFSVVPSTFSESDHPEREPAARAQVLAERKAEEVASRYPDAWVLGCDTLVVASDGALLEKPSDAAEAKKMITLQSGTTSVVHSALTLVSPDGNTFAGLSSSQVHFKKLSPEEIDWWIETGLWRERSGSFQIDGPGQLMIEKIEGDWSSVVGLPVFLLGKLCDDAGIRKELFHS
jgi:septum formation protein